ncbi:TetR/AcrR family transcriptional regulator [Pseudonocardia bannensis]|uniref:TetR/AcrR family transcriptional regulator n=1 Tax=Pseudonocardia bannensis TaxID=630973 RepID=A0A848DPJ0_9PSEU|nr:TetR/AcrR family transcriptional regulator [Pseudonocardia bannensis]
MFAEKGYHAVGIAEIGKAVGLTRGALYHHISSKEELLYEISVQYISDLVRSGEDILGREVDPEMRILLLSRYLMETIFCNQAEMTVCFREVNSLTGERRRFIARMHLEYQRLWERCIVEGAAKGAFRKITPVEVKGLLGMYFYSFLWLDPKGTVGAGDIADRFAGLVIRSLRP